MKVLTIVGSIRKDSVNLKLAKEVAKLAPKEMEIEIYIPSDLPLFTQDLEQNPPESVKKLKKKITDSDAILFVTPEHNHTISAVLKNAIEWGNRPWGDNSWDGKVAAIIGGGGASGTRYAQNHLRQIMVDLNLLTFNNPQVFVAKASERFDEKGNLVDGEIKKRITELLNKLQKLVIAHNKS